jgi:hypothetical protein
MKTLMSGLGGWSSFSLEKAIQFWWGNKSIEEFEALSLIVCWAL